MKCEDCVFYRRESDFNFTVIYCEKDQQNKSPENCEYYKGKDGGGVNESKGVN